MKYYSLEIHYSNGYLEKFNPLPMGALLQIIREKELLPQFDIIKIIIA